MSGNVTYIYVIINKNTINPEKNVLLLFMLKSFRYFAKLKTEINSNNKIKNVRKNRINT